MLKLDDYDMHTLMGLLKLAEEAMRETSSGELLSGGFMVVWPGEECKVTISQEGS